VSAYLLNGGYPEYFATQHFTGTDLVRYNGTFRHDENIRYSGAILYWQRILAEDIISKGLYRDIVSFYRIDNPALLERLLYLIAANTGGEHAYPTRAPLAPLAQTIGVDSATINTYLHYLSQAFLISVLENYSPNIEKRVRKNKKIYVTDNGIRKALLRNAVINPAEEGLLAENACIHIARSYAERNFFNLYYWRAKEQEVDMVVDKKTCLLPVEVKYRNQMKDEYLQGMWMFMEQYQAKTALVITKNTLAHKDSVFFIPLRFIR
jgi:predicted AAA+ superfamily ATPase